MSDVQRSSGNKYFLKWVAAICRGAGPLSLPAMLMMVFSPYASAAPLSLQGAEAIALRQNPGLGALTQKIAELRHKAVAVAQLPDPHLGLGAVNLPINSFSMNRQQMSMLSVGLSQTFPSFGKLGLEGQQAGMEAQMANFTLRGQAAELVLLLLSTTLASAAPLSLQSAEAIALGKNPGLGAIKQKVVELRHQAVAIAQLPDPHLVFGAANLPLNSFSMNQQQMSMLSVGLSQTFPSFGKLGLEGQQVGMEAQEAADTLRGQSAELVLLLRRAWLQALYTENAMATVRHRGRDADRATGQRPRLCAVIPRSFGSGRRARDFGAGQSLPRSAGLMRRHWRKG